MYDRGDYNAMRDDLAMEDWDRLLEGKTTEEQWLVISNRIGDAMTKFISSNVFGSGPERHKRPK